MDASRRSLLKGMGGMGALAAALATGLLKPTEVLAAEWNKTAFEARDIASALKGAGIGTMADSKDLTLDVPEIAEDSTQVAVKVASKIPGTTAISIFVEKNLNPLSAHFEFANGALPEIGLVKVKMAQTSLIKVVAKANGKFYVTQKEVKVTMGGCGG